MPVGLVKTIREGLGTVQMETIDNLRELFRYNDWANRRVAVSLKQAHRTLLDKQTKPAGQTKTAEEHGNKQACIEKAIGIFAHILTTEVEYFERLHGKDSTGMNFWPKLELEDCSELTRMTAEYYEKVLRRFEEEGLDIRVKYRTSAGMQKVNTIRELLYHVLMHSATHRGNIVNLLRSGDCEPPVIDYIIYLRETKYL